MSIRIGTQLVSQYLNKTTYNRNGNEIILNPLTINPSTTLQTFTPNANEAYSTVTVNPVTYEIDSNIIAKNIKEGVTILGVTGTLSDSGVATPTLQIKTVTPSTYSQIIVADSGYDGLDTVYIDPVTNKIDSNIIPGNIKNGVSILGITGTLEAGTGDITLLDIEDVNTYYNQIVTQVDKEYDMISGKIIGIVSQKGASDKYVYIKSLDSNITFNVTLSSWTTYNVNDIVILNPDNPRIYKDSTFDKSLIGYDLEYRYELEGFGQVKEVLFDSVTTVIDRALLLDVGTYSAESYCTVGKILAITTAYNDAAGYVSFNITDKNSTVSCYRATGNEAANLSVGDYVVVYGQLQNYNNTASISKPTIKLRIPADEIASGYELVDVDGAIEIGTSLETGGSSIVENYVVGEIYSIKTPYDSKYNNMTVFLKSAATEKGDFQCYRLSGEKGANIKVGDTIVAKGYISNYQGQAQLSANSIIISHISGRNNLLNAIMLNNVQSISASDLRGLDSIRGYLFYHCSKLKSIELSNSIYFIGEHAFEGAGLESITIPSTVGDIGFGAFKFCDFKEITIPNSIHIINTSTFDNCNSLETINLPDSLEIIDYSAFFGCQKLNNVTIPSSVTNINGQAFAYCTGLDNIIFKSGIQLETITMQLFDGCESLREINLPDSVKVIESMAFLNCYNLNKVSLPENITHLYPNIFYNCNFLTSINYRGTMNQWNSISDIDAAWRDMSAITQIVCTDGTINL